MDRARAFAPKQKTGYEIWFGAAFDKSGVALWFRYSVLHRPGAPSVCALWAAFFDPADPTGAFHAADAWPAAEQRFEDGRIVQPTGSCGCDDVRGEIGGLSWELRIEHQFAAESHVPAFLLNVPFIRTKSVVLSPFAGFSGVVRNGGRTWSFDARGTFTHIYGAERVPELYWCFVPEFDGVDAGMELFSVRPKPGAPLLTFLTLREGRTLTHTGVFAALRNTCRPDFPRFTASGAPRGFSLTCAMDEQRAASFLYVDPNGSDRYITQSDVSSATLTLQDGRVLTSHNRAAVEFHGRAPWNQSIYLDPYRKLDGV